MERKTEFILTLIGAILSGLFSLLMIGITFLIGIGISATSYTASDDYYYDRRKKFLFLLDRKLREHDQRKE